MELLWLEMPAIGMAVGILSESRTLKFTETKRGAIS
jgi:hypothetical protein